jgi:putative membrane-bound dehydrogenase-like protein
VIPRRLLLALGFLVFVAVFAGGAGEDPRTGPRTEQRFPPLKLPPGFRATLFACDPFIEYPSVIAAGPNANALFVGIDYLTGLGEEIVRRDEIRLIEDTDGDGYADRSTVFATGFNSIQGLAYHDGSVYVMHAPFLTVLRDTRGTGVADERRDLLTGLGLPPEKNRTRLHCANGVVVGHDGWLYLALGDNGTDVRRPEGDRLVLHGGGILRCRPDGRNLHVFATGLRNIYDVALDAELNVFVRDNENDGGDYKIRVCHSFFGADHGYPYLYYERPDEALPPLADLGLGSSAGGVCYLERAFPPEYRGDLFFCEWGRSVVRYQPRPAGSGFGPVTEIEFAAAAENDPYGFKPTDLVVQRDGALFIADWADGQRPKRGRGRIYRVTPTDPPKVFEKPATGLDSESYRERIDTQLPLEKQGAAGLQAVRQMFADTQLGPRGRLHAVWLLARGAGAVEELLKVATTDRDPAVRVQAVRALADLTDPVLVKHRLDAGPGDAAVARRLAALAEGADARLRREVVIALGRLKWADTPAWLARHVTKPDTPLAHAAMQALRAAGNWPGVLALLDRPTDDPVRGIALRAVAGQYEPALVDGLIGRLRAETDANRRRAYAEMLTRVYRKPGPWVYWGYRPGPRPANTADWNRTAAIAAALDRALADADRGVRLAVLRRMRREKVPAGSETLTRWLREERGGEAVGVILDALRDAPAAETSAALMAVVREKGYGTANRLRALALFAGGAVADDAGLLVDLARDLEHGPVLAELLRHMGHDAKPGQPAALAVKALPAYVTSDVPEVRAAAVEALGELRAVEGREPTLKLLGDGEPVVRRAAAVAAGKLALKLAAEPLLKLTGDSDAAVRRASLDALCQLREPRAVPLAVAALDDRETQPAALDCLAEVGGPEQAAAVAALARRAPPTDVLAAAVRLLAAWAGREGISPAKRSELDRTVAEVHGVTGALVRWTVRGPAAAKDAAGIVERYARVSAASAAPPDWRALLANAPEWRVRVGPSGGATADTVWFAHADVVVSDATPVEFTLTVAGTAEVWLNGKSLYRRAEVTTDRNAVARFPGELAAGPNRLLVRVGSPGAMIEYGLTFRRRSATAAHERLTRAALTRAGNAERGRAVFLDAEKSLCLKCHRAGGQGERVGPELTGIGARFGRVYLVESILEPSRTVVPGFATLRVELTDGRVFTGVKAAETDATLTLVDQEVRKHELKKAAILEQRPLAVSAMPDGLEKRLTEQEFVDLIAYLVSLKERGH